MGEGWDAPPSPASAIGAVQYRRNGTLKRLLATTALALGLASPALATGFTIGQIVNITGYSTPDAAGFNSITTTAGGAPDTPYSYYTGPITFNVQGGADITVYCVDLNHWLQTGQYKVVALDTNGEGQSLTESQSSLIGSLAEFGAGVGLGNIVDQMYAAAAQARIWDVAYAADGATSTSTGAQDTIDLLVNGFGFADRGFALALQPYGVDWPNNLSASQEMVLGFGSPVPEPSTWALGLIGFAIVGAMGYKKSLKRPVSTAASA
jgi:hypothetical protein